MDYKQWEQILNTINDGSDLNGNNVVEKIKEKLQTIDSDVYQEWEGKGFDINCQFDCSSYSKVTLLHLYMLVKV